MNLRYVYVVHHTVHGYGLNVFMSKEKELLHLSSEAQQRASTPQAKSEPQQLSIEAQIAIEFQRNRELSRKLYALRGEDPPGDVE